MPKVAINAPKTPVTKGSNGIAAATIPNICKMPGPPAPFVPTPLPNIGKSDDSPKGYSTSVKIEGHTVAIRGASFGSMGDVASQGTGGGIVSSCTQGRTTFIGPGSLNVKIEGKNVQLLGDPMLNNCASGGSPANAATMMGVIQGPAGMVVVVEDGNCVICNKKHGDFGETDQTRADAAGLAANFASEVEKVKGRIQTMLGVVRCKCGQGYADQSGATTVELCAAAESAALKHPGGVGVSCGSSKDEREVAYVDTLELMRSRMAGRMKDSDAFEMDWEEADERSRKSNKDRSGPASYPPGACAAQKTLMFLYDDGAIPAAMTERWHSSVGRPTQAPVQYVDRRQEQQVVRVEHFEHGSSVPPCGTCELLIPHLLCPGDKEECSHKT